jgi:hypothetical protein
MTLSGCGAPDEQPSRATQAVDAYVFKRQQAPLIPHDVQPFDEFGTAVGVSSRWAAVGSPGDDFGDDPIDDTGSAVVFERKQGNIWEEVTTLQTSESWPGARFGNTVAATDSVIVVGAPEADPAGDGSTVAAGLLASFAYDDGVWKPEPLLHDPNETEFGLFGASIALDARTLLVGAYGDDQVFAFPRTPTGWGEPVTLESPSPEIWFGYSVALDDPYALVGAPHADGVGDSGEDQGAVFVFKRENDTWIAQGELERNFVNANDQFGTAITARNGLAVSTAYGNGSVDFWQRDAASGWGSPFTVGAGTADSESGFGWSLAIGTKSSVWVGAYLDGNPNGAVYPFVHGDDRSWHVVPSVSFEEGGWFGYAVGSASGALMVGAPATGSDIQGAVYVIETSDGSSCTTDEECFSTHCVAGVCCNSVCDQPCYSCLSSEKASESADGTCEPKRSGSRPRAEGCVAHASSTCDTNGLCDGEGNCQKYAAGTQCGDPFCSENDVVGAALCDGSGACMPPVAQPCKKYVCSDGACLDSCRTHADCGEAAYCEDERCKPKLGFGKPCSAPDACLEGHCADGVCCDKACDGKCEACAEPGTEGSCVPLNAGSPPRVELATVGTDDGNDVCARLFCNGVEREAASLSADTSVVCAPAGCTDGIEVAEGRCNGEGRCDAQVLKTCGAYACGAANDRTGRPAQCLASCDSVSDCAVDFYCTTDHECQPIEPAPNESSGCSVSTIVAMDDWSCLGLLTSAITLVRLRRRQSTARSNRSR